ncbi:hypothetical protein B1H10_05510 [candidate division KSB1 bacterium 4484_188]|nr:MAG: hypothetical protein B1H10_05510 [candidate division KSB1 bacterium 4484_188]HFE64731.1 hypothetical protein [Caldithrix sp.]
MTTPQEKEKRKQKLNQVLEALQDTTPREYHAILNTAARKRPWRPRRTGWANVLDQALHASYGALLLLPVLLFHSYLGAAIMGLLAGGIREVEQFFNQDLRIRMFWDRMLDTSAFVAGALVIFSLSHL